MGVCCLSTAYVYITSAYLHHLRIVYCVRMHWIEEHPKSDSTELQVRIFLCVLINCF